MNINTLGLRHIHILSCNGKDTWTELTFRKTDKPYGLYIPSYNWTVIARHYAYAFTTQADVKALRDYFQDHLKDHMNNLFENSPAYAKAREERELKKTLKEMRRFEPKQKPQWVQQYGSMANYHKALKKGKL